MSQPLRFGRFRVGDGGFRRLAQYAGLAARERLTVLSLSRYSVDDRKVRSLGRKLAAASQALRSKAVIIEPHCPLRQQIVGSYCAKPLEDDPAYMAKVSLLSLAVGVGIVGLVHTHDRWMFYVELLISLCA